MCTERRSTGDRAASVAEDLPRLVPEPLEHRRRARDPRVGHEALRVDPSRVDAERAGEQLAAALRELREQPVERRAALAERALGGARLGEPHRLLGGEDRHLRAAAQRGPRDEEGDRDLLAVLHARGEVHQHLCGHLRPPRSTKYTKPEYKYSPMDMSAS